MIHVNVAQTQVLFFIQKSLVQYIPAGVWQAKWFKIMSVNSLMLGLISNPILPVSCF